MPGGYINLDNVQWIETRGEAYVFHVLVGETIKVPVQANDHITKWLETLQPVPPAKDSARS